MTANLSDLMKRRYPAAWQFFAQWSGKIIPSREPARVSLRKHDEHEREQIHAILASPALHAELHRTHYVLFYLENADSLLVLNRELHGKPQLMDAIKAPTHRTLADGSEHPHLLRKEDFPHARKLLRAFAEEAWVSPNRYYETSIASFSNDRRREVALFMAVRQYINSFELLFDKPVSFRFRAPWDVAAAASAIGRDCLANFSSPEAQAKALAARAA